MLKPVRTLAWRTRRQHLAARAERARLPAQGWLSPVLLVDGRMAGVWSHERAGDRVS